jgi:hypothetical protein
LRLSEWIVVGYLGCLVAAAWMRALPGRRRILITGSAAAVAGAVLLLRLAAPGPAVDGARDWLPGFYMLVGYWLSGQFFVRPRQEVEAWLSRIDRRVFARLGLEHRVATAPRPLLEALELAYLCCYPIVPAGFAILVVEGHREAADWYWSLLLLAAYLAYAGLLWVPTRPPRTLEGAGAIDVRKLVVRRVNLAVLARGSIQVNTLPSGHAATALAAALGLAPFVPAGGLAFLLIALLIVTGSVIGRYHYAMDAAAGFGVALLAWGVLMVLGF